MLGTKPANSLSEAVSLVLMEYGTEILHEPKRFISVMCDIYDPSCTTAEMQILVRNCDEDLFERFNRALSSDPVNNASLQQAAKSTCRILTDQRMIASNAAESFSNEFLRGISQYLAQTNRLDGPAPAPVLGESPKDDNAPVDQAPSAGPAAASSPKNDPAPSAQTAHHSPSVEPQTTQSPVAKSATSAPQTAGRPVPNTPAPTAQAPSLHYQAPRSQTPSTPAPNAGDSKSKGKGKWVRLFIVIAVVAIIVAIVTNSSPTTPFSQPRKTSAPTVLSKGARVVETSVNAEGKITETVDDWDAENTGLVILVKNNSNVALSMDLSASFKVSSGSKIADATDHLHAIAPGETGCFAGIRCYSDIAPSSVSYTIESTKEYEHFANLEGGVRVKELEVDNEKSDIRISNIGRQEAYIGEVTMLVKTPNGLTLDAKKLLMMDLQPGEDAEVRIDTSGATIPGIDITDCERAYFVDGYLITSNY